MFGKHKAQPESHDDMISLLTEIRDLLKTHTDLLREIRGN